QDVVDGAQGEGVVEEVGEQFLHAALGAVADEGQAQDELPQPGLGDRQPEEQLRRCGRCRGEGLVQGAVGAAPLLVDELAADTVCGGQIRDGLAGQGVERESAAHGRGQVAGGGRGRGARGAGGGYNAHGWDSCRAKGVVLPSLYGVPAFSAAPFNRICYPALNQAQKGSILGSTLA